MARKTDAALAEKILPPHQRGCDYCAKGSIGTVNGISHCREHAWDAMDGRKTKVVSIGAKADSEVVDKKLQSCGS